MARAYGMAQPYGMAHRMTESERALADAGMGLAHTCDNPDCAAWFDDEHVPLTVCAYDGAEDCEHATSPVWKGSRLC